MIEMADITKKGMIFNCKLHIFSNCGHLQQIYAGFNELLKNKIINIEIDTREYSQESVLPLLKIILNDEHSIYYDTYDGYNFSDNSLEEGLEIFNNYLKDSDYYFKRSCNKEMNKMTKHVEKIFPLGLNYGIDSSANESIIQKKLKNTVKDKLCNMAKDFKYNELLSRVLKKNYSYIKQQSVEYVPKFDLNPKILFVARLWDPDMVENECMKCEWEEINKMRITCVRRLKREFKNAFIGGIIEDLFSKRKCKELNISAQETRRDIFIRKMQSSDICVATTGLHKSIGWKFAEYVASSKAIVTEPLQCELPGSFCKENNYYEFTDPDECVESIYKLMKNHKIRLKMMQNNYYYYNNFVRPDSMILNTLYHVLKKDLEKRLDGSSE